MGFSLQFLISILLDIVFGDPRWYPHPVRGIGLLCTVCEKRYRALCANVFLAGFATVATVVTVTAGIVYGVLYTANIIHPALEGLIAIFLLYTTIATKDLLVHSNKVYMALENESLTRAREEVGKIVGRDTTNLTDEEVSKACVETVAENMVDGITAPLFFAVLASCAASLLPLSAIACAAVGGFLYKAVNTMDSMIAYKNETYLVFGRVAAKLDDAVNFLPARCSGLCLIAAAWVVKMDYRKAATVFFRDRLNHSSPNAAHSEAAVAGALKVRLGGPSTYFGKVVDKPYIGDFHKPINPEDILLTNRLVIVGSAIFVLVILGIRYLLAGSL